MTSTKKTMVSGVMYTALAKYIGLIVSLAVTGVLSRLLPPSDFGIVAIATVIIAFLSIFSDLGIAPAIIQYKGLTRHEIRDIFSFTIWSGLVISLIFFCTSPLIAAYYESPQLTLICQLLSLNLFFAAINIVPNALLYKEKRFRFIATRNLSVQSAVGVVAVGAAFWGAGIYALLINPIVSSLVLFVINLREYPMMPRLTTGLASLRQIFSFSAYQFSFNLINYFSRNLDKLLIGRYMGMSPLGYYEKSYRLMMLPLYNITHVITPVMHPILSEFQNDMERLAAGYIRMVRLLALVGFPLSALLYFIAPELILLIFGTQWEPSVPVFRILSLSVGIQIILSTSGSLYQAAGATKTLFFSGIFSTIFTVSAMCIGIFWFGTLEAVAWSIIIAFAMNFITCYYMMFYLTLRVSWAPFWAKFGSPMLMTALVALPLWALDRFVLDDIHLFFSLCIKIAVGGLISALYLQYAREYNIRWKIKTLIESRRK